MGLTRVPSEEMMPCMDSGDGTSRLSWQSEDEMVPTKPVELLYESMASPKQSSSSQEIAVVLPGTKETLFNFAENGPAFRGIEVGIR